MEIALLLVGIFAASAAIWAALESRMGRKRAERLHEPDLDVRFYLGGDLPAREGEGLYVAIAVTNRSKYEDSITSIYLYLDDHSGLLNHLKDTGLLNCAEIDELELGSKLKAFGRISGSVYFLLPDDGAHDGTLWVEGDSGAKGHLRMKIPAASGL